MGRVGSGFTDSVAPPDVGSKTSHIPLGVTFRVFFDTGCLVRGPTEHGH